VEEETGIKLNLEDMVDLTALLDPATGGRMIPSPVPGLHFPSVRYYLIASLLSQKRTTYMIGITHLAVSKLGSTWSVTIFPFMNQISVHMRSIEISLTDKTL
jgi:hypothetical protein